MKLYTEGVQEEICCMAIMLDGVVRCSTLPRWRSKNPSLEQGRKPLRHAPCLGHGSRLRSRVSHSEAVAGLRVLPHRFLSSPYRQSGAAAPYVVRAPRATGSPVLRRSSWERGQSLIFDFKMINDCVSLLPDELMRKGFRCGVVMM